MEVDIMAACAHATSSFPTVRLPSAAGAAPVEVALIAQLGIGAGDRLIVGAARRQAGHAEFVDALDEPSTRLGAMHLAHGDTSSLYSFVVGPGGHPFHRHATPRIFTAVSGSGGAELRFSSARPTDIEHDPAAFVAALRIVTIPPDCLFTVRFGEGTWHQFVPRSRAHPALFALSCHTNELGDGLDDAQRARVIAGAATIPSLTEVLPQATIELLGLADSSSIPRVDLALHGPPFSLASRACALMRSFVGGVLARLEQGNGGYLGRPASKRAVFARAQQPEDSLLERALPAMRRHDDCVSLTLSAREVGRISAHDLLGRVLEGFLANRPAGVSRLMALRNFAVAPLKLRSSPLGCPVSSLLSGDRRQLYGGRYPVLEQQTTERVAQVLLGADDRHLLFRSCVRVQMRDDGSAEVSLGTSVRTRNTFGRLYMAAIGSTHRRCVAPSLLRMAVDYALAPELGPTTAGFAETG